MPIPRAVRGAVLYIEGYYIEGYYGKQGTIPTQCHCMLQVLYRKHVTSAEHSHASTATQSVSDEQLARLFRRFPGMEYCDLKKDRTTGRSKVRSS